MENTIGNNNNISNINNYSNNNNNSSNNNININSNSNNNSKDENDTMYNYFMKKEEGNLTYYDNNISNRRELVMNKFNDLGYRYSISNIID
jgi:hypothetical protein